MLVLEYHMHVILRGRHMLHGHINVAHIFLAIALMACCFLSVAYSTFPFSWGLHGSSKGSLCVGFPFKKIFALNWCFVHADLYGVTTNGVTGADLFQLIDSTPLKASPSGIVSCVTFLDSTLELHKMLLFLLCVSLSYRSINRCVQCWISSCCPVIAHAVWRGSVLTLAGVVVASCMFRMWDAQILPFPCVRNWTNWTRLWWTGNQHTAIVTWVYHLCVCLKRRIFILPNRLNLSPFSLFPGRR